MRFLRDLETIVAVREEESPETKRCIRSRVRQRLQSHEATRKLWERWSLPVYFQLRHSEITGAVDEAIKSMSGTGSLTASMDVEPVVAAGGVVEGKPSNGNGAANGVNGAGKEGVGGGGAGASISTSTSSLILDVALEEDKADPLEIPGLQRVRLALAACWVESVTLRPLLHRFLKLTLQILARLDGWVGTVVASADSSGTS